MMKLASLIVGFAVVLLVGCGGSRKAERLVVFGHSYVEGVPPVTSWATRVAVAQDLPLINQGHHGDGCAATSSIAQSYEARDTDVVVIEDAINDTRRDGIGGVDKYETCLTRLVRHVQVGGPLRVVLVADPPIVAWNVGPQNGSDAASKAYGRATAEVAKRTGARFVDLSIGWVKARDITADGIHPSDAGAARISDAVRRAIRLEVRAPKHYAAGMSLRHAVGANARARAAHRLTAARRLRRVKKVGQEAEVWGAPAIEATDLEIGHRFILHSKYRTTRVAGGGKIRIGSGVFLNHGSSITATKSVTIGDHVALSQDATIMDSDGHGVEGGPIRVEPVTIGSGTWIGLRAVVLPGVTIGRRCVIAAGAVVASDIPDDSLAGGVPARVIRPLTYPEGTVRAWHGGVQ
jgi:maltose O-acetyltransferase